MFNIERKAPKFLVGDEVWAVDNFFTSEPTVFFGRVLRVEQDPSGTYYCVGEKELVDEYNSFEELEDSDFWVDATMDLFDETDLFLKEEDANRRLLAHVKGE